jgi:hypothetical protein
MTVAPYQAMHLVPGVGTELFSAESGLSGLIYGPLHLSLLLPYARVSGAARDASNSPTTVLRPGLVMAKITASDKWSPFVSGASDGTQYALGILTEFGLNTQIDGADADRWMATILVKGNVNPSAICLTTSATYGLARASVGLAVRKHFKYNFTFSDDLSGDLIDPLSGR